MFEGDLDGGVAWANTRWCEVTGVALPHGRSDRWLSSVHPEDRRRLIAAWHEVGRTGAGARVHVRLTSKGSACPIGVRLGALRDARGRVVGVVGTLEDRFEELPEAVPVGVFGLNFAGDVTFVNERACEIMGRTREEVLAEGWRSAIHPDDLLAVRDTWERGFRDGREHRLEHRLLTPDGRAVWVLTAFTPSGAVGAQPDGCVGTVIDLTVRKDGEEELRQSRAYLARAQEIAGVGVWDLEVETGRVEVSENVYEMTGVEPGAEFLFADFMGTVHFEDRPRLAAAVEEATRHGESVEVTYRIHHARSHAERVLRINATSQDDGRLLGTVIDITDQVESERLLARAQEIAHLGSWDWDIVTGDLSWSDEIYRIFGLKPQEFAATYAAFLERVHPDDRAGLEAAVGRAIETHTPYAIEHRVVRPDGEERIVHEQGEVTYAPDGTPIHMIGTVLDVTDQVESKRRLSRAQEIAHLGSWEWEIASGEVKWSDETFRILGLAPGEIAPSYTAYFERVHPDDRARVEGTMKAALAAHAPFGDEHRVVRPDGEERIVMGQGYVVGALDGTPIRVMGALLDVTARALAEKALRHSEERFRRLAAHAPVGIYEMDLDGACRWVNDPWCRITGLSAVEALGAAWVEAIHPEDREGVLSAWRQAVSVREPFACEFRLRSADGLISWVTARAIALIDPADAVTGYLGTIADVTERVRAEREQRALRRVATAVAAGTSARGVFALVAEQVADTIGVRTCSVVQFDAVERVAVVVGGWSEDQGVTAPGSRLSLDDGRVLARVFGAGRAARGEETGDFGGATGGDAGAVSVAATPVRLGHDPWGAIAVADSTTRLPVDTVDRLERFCDLVGLALANAEARRQLESLASLDHLTGLPNRRSFQERLAAEFARARQLGQPLSLAVLDIDHFKEINDSLGHEGGDRVLIEFAHRLAGLARSGETMARIGGEEFAWIMPEADATGGLAGAERARQLIANEPFPAMGTVTVSAGVCDLEHASSATELLRRADVALYRAKNQGRNRVCRYLPEEVEPLSVEE